MTFNILRRFRTSEKGSLSVETVLAVPMLAWAIMATFVFWDGFKTLNVSQKATYTIADLLSRETQTVDADYLLGMHEVYDYLANAAGDNAIRVTVVELFEDSAGNEFPDLVWSQGVGGIAGYTDIDTLEDRLPILSLGEQIIIVESEQDWSPAFSVGLGTLYRFRDVAISRPRFAPEVVWDASSGSPIGGSV